MSVLVKNLKILFKFASWMCENKKKTLLKILHSVYTNIYVEGFVFFAYRFWTLYSCELRAIINLMVLMGISKNLCFFSFINEINIYFEI